jgi:hypothetical protein
MDADKRIEEVSAKCEAAMQRNKRLLQQLEDSIKEVADLQTELKGLLREKQTELARAVHTALTG